MFVTNEPGSLSGPLEPTAIFMSTFHLNPGIINVKDSHLHLAICHNAVTTILAVVKALYEIT